MGVASFATRILSPLLVFAALYLAALAGLVWLGFPLIQWAGLLSVTLATIVTIVWLEQGRWNLGLFLPFRRAALHFAAGSAIGGALVGLCALLVAATTDLAHRRGEGFPWADLLLVFIPAALHEELLFRGYPFQKILHWNRAVALFLVAALFAALHANNPAVTPLGLGNIFLGGILLGVAYERTSALWLPIGIHLAWNLMTGPILGHEVSGYSPPRTLFIETGSGPEWLTGGDFGIEGSVWMTAAELTGIALLVRRRNEYDRPRSRSEARQRSEE